MTVINVAITNADFINNYRSLPPSWQATGLSDVTINIHYSPRSINVGDYVSRNYDINIVGKIDGYSLEIPSEEEGITDVLHRPRKSVMQQMLRSAAKGLQNFYMIPTYTVEGESLVAAPPVSRFVIKPEHGARGIGQLVVDPTQVSLSALLKDIRLELSDIKTEEAVNAYFKALEPHVTYHTGNEKFSLEGIQSLASTEGVVVQDYVNDVTDEYRLIVSHGKVVYAQQRARKGCERYKQATGTGDTPIRDNHRVSMNDIPNAPEIKQAMAVLAEKVGSLFSFDLFVTGSKRWGGFEFSNQFGHQGICDQEYMTIMMENVEETVRKAYFDELSPLVK